MEKITVNAPRDINCDQKQWDAHYSVSGSGAVRYITIESRSSIEVVVAKVKMQSPIDAHYFIAVPNFGVAIPGIGSLQESFWIREKLMRNGLPTPDAVTVAQVISCLEDF